jgi:hypothetical protein
MEKGKGHNKDRYDITTSPNYQQGFRDGQSDRTNRRPHQYRERTDPRNNDPAQNRAYEAGYDAGWASVRGGGYDRRDNDRRDSRDVTAATRPNYEQGLRDGRRDRETNQPHQYRERADPRNNDPAQNRAYEAGYDEGYRSARPNEPYDRRGRDDRYGVGRLNDAAARNGAQDGYFDGQKDRRTGHSNRPTQGDWYKSATRGYDSSLGDREQYKLAYRQAYLPAYQRGYTGQ